MKNYKINDWEELSIKKSVKKIEKSVSNNIVTDVFSYISLIIALVSIVFTFDFDKKVDIIVTIVVSLIVFVVLFLLCWNLYDNKIKNLKRYKAYTNDEAIDCFDNKILGNVMMANSLMYTNTNSQEEELQIISQISYYINSSVQELLYISKYKIFSENLKLAFLNQNIAIQRVEILNLNLENLYNKLETRINALLSNCNTDVSKIINDIRDNNESNQYYCTNGQKKLVFDTIILRIKSNL